MGYTHYFRQQRRATTEEWAAICADFKKLFAAALLTNTPMEIQREDDNDDEPLISTNEIIFNGIEDNGHETMVLDRNGSGFQFCKTARKPYDRAVCCLLMIAHKHAPDVWQTSSDGGIREWGPHMKWLNSLGMGEFTVPWDLVGGEAR